MIKKDKVITMTKLAIYEKNKGKNDMGMMDYFKLDYIALNNFKIQVGVTIALMFILGIHATGIFVDNMSRITEIDFLSIGKEYLKIWIIVMIGYTIVSSVFHWIEYSRAKNRMNEYVELINQMEKYSK